MFEGFFSYATLWSPRSSLLSAFRHSSPAGAFTATTVLFYGRVRNTPPSPVMKSLLPRTLLVKLFYSSSHFRNAFLRFHLFHSDGGDEAFGRRKERGHTISSSSSFFNSPSFSRRNFDEENRNVKITVWWDFENCNIPVGVNVHLVASRITRAIRSSGMKGPVTITAFGDVAQLSRATQEALTSTGVCLTHVPHSGKNSSDRSFMADIVYWVSQNPPPAHFFLISGDKDFANILHRLRMSNYNILIASTETASGVLCSAATIMWPWNILVRGENISARHFNHPPDGLIGSWYGHYKGVLDNPFTATNHPTTSLPEESVEPIPVPKLRPVPKAVVNAIHQVLYSYPEGISLSELRSELRKNNIFLDKDLYGHKKFSYFLAKLDLLKAIPPPTGDGQPLAVDSPIKEPEQPDISPNPCKEIHSNDLHQENGFALNEGDPLISTASVSTEHHSVCKGRNLDANICAATLNKSDHPVIDLKVHKDTSVPQSAILDSSGVSQKRESTVTKEGVIKKLWNSLSHRIVSVLKGNDNILELYSSRHEDSKNASNVHSPDLSDHVRPKDMAADMNNIFTQKEDKEISSRYDDNSVANDSNPGQSETPNYVCEEKVGLFGRIMKWYESMMYGANGHNEYFESDDKVHQIDTSSGSCQTSPLSSNNPAAHELFLNPHFWDDLESFLMDPKGRHIILKSITREQLLRRLQNEGPSSLKKLDDNHLSHLGDILILEKKWVEESAFQKFPYKLLITPKNSFSASQSFHLNGVSSVFTAYTNSNLHKLSDQEKEAKEMPLTGSMPPSNFEELGLWFHKHVNCSGDIEPEKLQKIFEDKFKSKFSCLFYGYGTIPSLIAALSSDASNALHKKSTDASNAPHKESTDASIAPHKKSVPPSRDEMLSDCSTLLKELLDKTPTGFYTSFFQSLFLVKYGYNLDYKALGYPKLTKFLQTLPGIKVEGTFIHPSKESMVDAMKKEQDCGKNSQVKNGHVGDSAWDELGPLSNSTNSGKDKDCKADKEAIFIPVSLSDDEYTDSEEDTPRSDKSRNCKQSGDDGSLLLKILHSWDDNKEGGAGKQRKNINVMAADCPRTAQRKFPKNDATSLQRSKLRASPKRFSFVSKDADDKELFAESILGEVKKAGDLRLKESSK